MSVVPVLPISAEALGGVAGAQGVNLPDLAPSRPGAFLSMLTDGIADTEAKVTQAGDLARAFVLDDDIPVHQVTFALEEARMSLELMLQVRSRIIEGYQQLMTLQL